MRATASLILLSLVAVDPASAQARENGRSGDRRFSMVVETMQLFRVNAIRPGVLGRDDLSLLATWEVGPMWSRDRIAWGIAFFAGADADGARLGIRPRYRRWLGAQTALDLGAGFILGGRGSDAPLMFPSVNGAVTLSYGDWLGATLQLDAIGIGNRAEYEWGPNGRKTIVIPSARDWGLYAGLRFGGVGALVATVTELVVGVIVLSNADFCCGS